MSKNVKITSQGIIRILKNYNYKQAIAEYVWNGFDAKATVVNINYSANEIDTITSFEISDNGYGIDFNKLKEKFEPFFESEKAIEYATHNHTSVIHGKNGVGRLTFFTFANSATWYTSYLNGTELKAGQIEITVEGLNNYQSTILSNSHIELPGTTVRFSRFTITKANIELEIIPFLIREFCWFLELNKSKKFKIIINGADLDYKSNIIDSESFNLPFKESKPIFKIEYIQWNESLLKEHSKFYFLNDEGNEVFKDFTTLNRKGDQYYHSLYIQSDFFKGFDFKSNENDTQINLFSKAKSSYEYRFLITFINEFLRKKRKPFLKNFASVLINQYEANNIFPTYKTEWETEFKKKDLIETVKALYEIQPKLFNNLNVEQKKTFVGLLDLLLDSSERENIFKILDEIIDLEPDEREDLVRLFKVTRLNRIIETIKLIEDRYKTYYMLKDLVFNPELKADEVHHLQKMIESHYWIFGEQYHLVTAAEPKFEEALRRFIFHLTEKDTSPEIDHPHKLKEMDIFACRQNILVDRIENIVIELKHPTVSLGEEQYSQVHKYLQVITSQPEFNASNMYWEFYLIGKKFNTSNYIDDLIDSNKNHGTPHLVLSKDNGRVKVYAKKWSEVFADFEIKHKHLDAKLKFEREQLTNEMKTADEVILSSQKNSAVQPNEILISNG